MATSAEAQRRWNHNPQDLAGMLYAAVLDRAPDPGGLTAYTQAIRQYGLGWATAQMLGSQEYLNRLVRICGVKNGLLSAAMFDWQTAMTYATGPLLDRAFVLAEACGATKLMHKLTSFKDNVKTPRAVIGIAGEGARVLNGWLGNEPCKATLAVLEAIAYIAIVVEIGQDGHNPVFIQLSSNKNWLKLTDFKFHIGRNPTDWREFGSKTL